MLKNKTFFFETSTDTGSKSVSDSKAVTMTSNDKIERESRESVYSDAKDLTKIKDSPTLNIDPELLESLKLIIGVDWMNYNYSISSKNEVSNEDTKDLLNEIIHPLSNSFTKKSESKNIHYN